MKKNDKLINLQFVEDRLQKQLFFLGVVCLIFGLLYTINPKLSRDIVLNISAIVLLVVGLLQIFEFLRGDQEQRAAGSHMGFAFVAIAFALYLFMHKTTIDMAITIVAAVLFFFQAGIYFQIGLIQFKQKMESWWQAILFCLIAVLAGVYVLTMSAQVDDLYIRLCGIFMLVLTAFDAFTILNLSKLSESGANPGARYHSSLETAGRSARELSRQQALRGPEDDEDFDRFDDLP